MKFENEKKETKQKKPLEHTENSGEMLTPTPEVKQDKPLGYAEGSGGMLTPYYSEEERLKILEELRDNAN